MATVGIAATVLIFICGLCTVVKCQPHEDRIEMNCDPRINHRFQHCPAGYCCVRDEYELNWVYCQRAGLVQEDCTTSDSETNCPCGAGLRCQPNIVSDTHVSLYGTCEDASSEVTTPCPHGQSCEHHVQP